jgi:hypothetical protein
MHIKKKVDNVLSKIKSIFVLFMPKLTAFSPVAHERPL